MRRTRALPLVVALLVAACDQPPPRTVPSIIEVAATCDPGPEQGACFRRFERGALAAAPGVARRGDTLAIETARGGPVTFVSVPDSLDEGPRWLYLGYQPAIESHVIYEQEHESYLYALVHARHGWRALLDAPPIFSPDSQRILTASWDTDAAFVANRARIFRITPDSLVLEWEIVPELWGPVDAHWLDARSVQMRRAAGALHPDSTALRAPLRVTMLDGRWTVDSTASPSP